jgi:signal transduction histidine kinase
VRDNGKGFAAMPGATNGDGAASAAAATAAVAAGQGLRSMTRRAEAIGGRLTVTSAPGAGTTIALDAPVR